MTFWDFLDKYKTRISGYVLVFVSFFQAQPALWQDLVSDKAFAVITLAIGVVVALIGHSNASRQPPPTGG